MKQKKQKTNNTNGMLGTQTCHPSHVWPCRFHCHHKCRCRFRIAAITLPYRHLSSYKKNKKHKTQQSTTKHEQHKTKKTTHVAQMDRVLPTVCPQKAVGGPLSSERVLPGPVWLYKILAGPLWFLAGSLWVLAAPLRDPCGFFADLLRTFCRFVGALNGGLRKEFGKIPARNDFGKIQKQKKPEKKTHICMQVLVIF